MKLYYLNIYGRGEPLRMCLWKAGVEFEDIKLEMDDIKEMRDNGELEFGQVPMLELDDGTKLCQTMAILNYLGTVYGLKPKDREQVYLGEKLYNHTFDDIVMKHVWKTMFSGTLT